jgi:hypothetical protein
MVIEGEFFGSIEPPPPSAITPPFPCFSLFSLCVAVKGCLIKLSGEMGGAKSDDYKKAILYIPYLPIFTMYENTHVYL